MINEGYDYLVCLWKKDIIRGVPWRLLQAKFLNALKSHGNDQLIFPFLSWSWAGARHVKFIANDWENKPQFCELATLEQATLEQATPDAATAYNAALLVLSSCGERMQQSALLVLQHFV